MLPIYVFVLIYKSLPLGLMQLAVKWSLGYASIS